MEDNSLLFQYLSSILDGEEIKLFLHAEVVEGQIDSALRVGDDQPHTVHVVAILLGVVGRQQHPGRSGEVEKTGNYRGKKENKVQSLWLCFIHLLRKTNVFYYLVILFCAFLHIGAKKKQHCTWNLASWTNEKCLNEIKLTFFSFFKKILTQQRNTI